ncbi:uncharacterized protein LOC122261026 [Penaeus japonicus]|uniref:uncharacterized protein LOC122261026 n=1 Tax=Penaeus japonicus TaxID=27405 RepID=UPI001C70DD1B|nr:uncharacterized protein LOC122261026 [Penaeus japonicus]
MDRILEDLFNDDRGEKPKVEKNMEGPPIIKSEVRVAIGKMKKNKAPGPDKIVTEMIKALDEFGIDKMTEIINEIYDSGEIPEELSKSIFIALPKKPGAIEYLDGKDIRLIRNLYWEQKACMRVDNDTSKYTPICRGVRQGCVLSPDLFNLYRK